jgi:hypothetical protein
MCDVCPDIDDEIAHTTKDYCDICHRETEQRPKDLIKEMQSRKLSCIPILGDVVPPV